MKDTEINKKYGVPLRTLQHWKHKPTTDWRYKVYMKLKADRD